MKNNFSIILALIFCFSCEHELERNNPLDGLVLGEIEEIDMGANFVVLSGSITTNKITPVSDYGFCWTLEGSIPTFDDPHNSNGELVDKEDFVFQSTISGLELNQVYCFRLFAVTSIDTAYSNEFFTSTEWDGESPIINTNSVNLITSNSATVEGELIDLGDPTVYGIISQHGHCWSSIHLPTINDNKSELGTLSSTGTFNTNIESLNTSTTYYCRSYIVNNAGTIYGNSIEFNTTNGEPSITTGESTNITSTTADVEGEVIGIGDAAITQYGHCWSTSQNPTTNNDKTTLGLGNVGIFTSNLSSLTSNTQYYYRAYATNSFGTVYGSSLSFSTTNGEPTVVTLGSNNITSTTVDLEGDITSIGDASVTQHGHCWSTNSNPTINNSKTTLGASVLGNFTSNISNLTHNTTYYYRAYATNSFGTVYGSSLSFSTINGGPTVFTIGSDNITASTVDLEGDITSIGDASVNQHGHCWSTSSSPTINDDKTTLGLGNMGIFTSNVSSLTASTQYYYRAYATNSFGTAYGNEMSFTTAGLWVNIGQLSGVTYNNNAMLVLSSDNVWIVGTDIWNWDGSIWSTISNPSSYNLVAVHGTSSNNIWIVDDNDEIWKWNGSSWTSYPGASTGINNVQDILVFGNSIVIGGTQNFGPGIKISTNSGSSWSLEYPTCSSNCQGFSDMDGNSNNNIWVGTGSFTNNGVQGTVVYNGISWSSNENMYNIQCLSVLNSNSAFATSAPNSGSWYPTIWEYNGGWNSISLPTGMDMNWGYTPIDAVQSNAVWFGSDKIYKYNGNSWDEETGSIGSEIQIIRMLNTNEGFAVTGNGTILKR
jgi:hypothetical protein